MNYDERADRIIASKDYNECRYIDNEGNCRLKEQAVGILKGKTRCWHVIYCPEGKRRNV